MCHAVQAVLRADGDQLRRRLLVGRHPRLGGRVPHPRVNGQPIQLQLAQRGWRRPSLAPQAALGPCPASLEALEAAEQRDKVPRADHAHKRPTPGVPQRRGVHILLIQRVEGLANRQPRVQDDHLGGLREQLISRVALQELQHAGPGGIRLGHGHSRSAQGAGQAPW